MQPSKAVSELAPAQVVSRGREFIPPVLGLTQREMQVIELLLENPQLRDQDIGKLLDCMTAQTIKNHLSSIGKKLAAHTRERKMYLVAREQYRERQTRDRRLSNEESKLLEVLLDDRCNRVIWAAALLGWALPVTQRVARSLQNKFAVGTFQEILPAARKEGFIPEGI